MNTNTPRTDAETTLMTLDCDDSCVEIYLKRDGKVVEGDEWKNKAQDRAAECCIYLRERDEARAFVESLRTAMRRKDKERPTIAEIRDRISGLHSENEAMRDQLARICKEGFDNQDTIGQEPADDYVLRKLAEVKAERDLARERGQDMVDFLSIAEGERDHYRRENAEMREAINEASKRLQSIQLNDIFEETMRYNAALALAKLKPFLK